MNIEKKAFTLVELIVSIIIIALLAAIGFYSYVGYLSEARDAQRKANIGEIITSLKSYKQKRGAYPVPGNNFNITNSGVIVAIQGKLNHDVSLSTMEKIPLDPYTENEYTYSITKNKQESQITLTLENGEFPISLIEGDYKTVSKYVLPTIVLATGSITSIEIHSGVLNGTDNRNLFILDGGQNLPYDIAKPNNPLYASGLVDDVLDSGNINFWQNSSYRTCDELKEASKLIHESGTEEYQLLHENGYLINTGCLLP